MSTETVVHGSGAKSSACPRLDLIPYEASVRMAARFESGMQRYGLDNWRKGLRDEDYVADRIAHLMDHAARFLAKMRGHLPDDGEDDAAAILWAGAFLASRTTCACGVTIRPIQRECHECETAALKVILRRIDESDK